MENEFFLKSQVCCSLFLCLFLSMEFSWQTYWSGLPVPAPGGSHLVRTLHCCAGGDSWESPGLQGERTYPFWRKSSLSAHWKDRLWSWGSITLAISWEEKTPWKRPWCWESVKARGEGDDWGQDGWTVSSKRPTWLWPNSRRQWKTGGPSMLWSMGSQRVGHD